MSQSPQLPGSQPRERLLSIQALRGIAAMLVVMVHMNNIEHKYYHTHLLQPFSWGWIGVDIFFVISGVVISIVTETKFQSIPNAFTFLYHRLARIFPVFWFYYSLCLAAYVLSPRLFNASEGHHIELLRSFFLIPGQFRNLVGQAWSLSYELYFYLVFFLFMTVTSRRMAGYLLAGWASVITCIYFVCPIPGNLHILWTASNPFVLEFLAGCLAYRLFREVSLSRAIGPLCLGLSLLWIAAVVAWTVAVRNTDAGVMEQAFWARPLCCGLFAFLLVFGAMLMERARQVRVRRIFAVLGDWSYSIYLSHMVILEVIALLVRHWFASYWFGIIVTLAISIPTVVVAGFLSYRFIECPVIRYTHEISLVGKRERMMVSETV